MSSAALKRIVLVAAITCCALIVVAEPPPRPHHFYGVITVDGNPVAEGVVVSAEVLGAEVASGSVFRSEDGSAFVIDIPGDIPETAPVEGAREGDTVVFKLDGSATPETALWQSGIFQRFDLTASAGTDLRMTKENNVDDVDPGDTLNYVLTVTNNGPFTARGIVVEDNLPPSTAYLSASDGGAESGGVVTFPPFDLAVGASVIRTLNVQVASAFAVGTVEVVNRATVRSDGTDGIDPAGDNNTAIDADALAGGPDLRIEKTADVAEIAPGEDVVYTLTVSNHGHQDARDVALFDTLPPSVIFLTASDDGRQVGGRVDWPSFDLALGESVSRTVRVRLPPGISANVTELSNTATVSNPLVPDLHIDDNLTTHVLPVSTRADLTVLSVSSASALVDPQELLISGQVTAEVSNLGNADAAPFELAIFEDLNHNGAYEPAADNLLGQIEVPSGVLAGETVLIDVPVSGALLFRNNQLHAFADLGDLVAEHDETNNVDHSARACEAVPTPEDFDPVVELSWPAGGIDAPGSIDSLSTPLVVQLTDDNGDGRFDERDVPDLVFVTYDLVSTFDPQPRLRAIRGDTGEAIFDALPPISDLFQVFALTGLAAGDIDLDGRPEIIVSTFDFRGPSGRPNRLTAYEHNGTRKWVSAPYNTHPDGDTLTNRDNPSIVQLDGEGAPEIVVGANVFNANGSLRWAGGGGQGYQSARNADGVDSGAISIVADLDLDGQPEIVTGNTAYRADGSIYWQIAGDDGYPAVGNFDVDDFPEIVVVSRGHVRLHEHDGTLLWTTELPGAGEEAGGAPTIAHFDQDPEPEIGVAGSTMYVVFEHDGTIKWQSATQDGSSNMTGSTVFDLDGDGRFEVIYRDEAALRIYRGEDGVVLFEEPLSSITLNEAVVVADVDGDGNAEIVVTSDVASQVNVPTRTRGLRVFGDANDNWVAARGVWNQHAYHIDNIGDDGFTVPNREEPGWLSHNTYRANIAPATGAFASPDISASRISVDLTAFPNAIFTARIGNGGTTFVGAGLSVAFYDGDPATIGQLIGVATVPRDLDPGKFTEVSVPFVRTSFGQGQVFAVADDDGTGQGAHSECDEANNVHGFTYNTDVLGLLLTLSDGDSTLQPGEQVTYTVTVGNGDLLARGGVEVSFDLSPHVGVAAISDGGIESAGIITWPTFDLAGGATAVRSVTLQVDPTIPLSVNQLTQTASVTDDGGLGADPTPENNTASDTNAVLTVRADAGGPYAGDEGATITFDASASSDRDGGIVAYEWDLNADDVFETTGVSASRAFPDNGTYTVTVRVTDDSGEQDTASANVVVTNLAAGVDAGPDLSRVEGGTALLSGVFTDAGVADTHTATVNWGDGTVEAGTVVEADGAGTVTGSHIYPDDGVFTVELCVSDDDGASACDTSTITVDNQQPLLVEAGDVDLATWTGAHYGGAANWQVSEDGLTVNQTRNTDPSVFYGDFNAIGVVLEGGIRVNTSGDDDFIGFVLGFQPGDSTNPDANFVLIDWKQGNQGDARRGLALSRIRGVPTSGNLWAHSGAVEELARGLTRGSTGWADFTEYTFRFQTTPTQIKVWVNDTLELEVDGEFNFGDGRFGFYNYSQSAVIYRSFSSQGVGLVEGQTAEVSLPFADSGVEDTHTGTINWADTGLGSLETGTIIQGEGFGTIQGSHLYADDGAFDVELCVTDDDGGTGCASVPVTVVNAFPSVDAGEDRLAYVGEGLTLAGDFVDLGVLDTHTAKVDWGDGELADLDLMQAAGSGTISGTHHYAAPGTYNVEACVTDDDGDTGCDGFTVTWLEPVVDLTLQQSTQLRSIRPDEVVTFTLDVVNNGTREPLNVLLTNVLPLHLTFVAASDGGVYDAGSRSVTWTIPEVSYLSSLQRILTVRGESTLPFGEVVTLEARISDDGQFGADANPSDNISAVSLVLWDGFTPRVQLNPQAIVEGEELPLAVTFDDAQSGETHSATIDWGDGTVEAATLAGPSPGAVLSGTVSGIHTYRDDLQTTLEVCVTDSEGHTGCDAVALAVANALPGVSDSGDIDLRTWRTDHYDVNANQGRANWVVADDGQSVLQVVNSRPSIFYGDFPAFGTRITGKIKVETRSDDDFVGFALGYHPDDSTNEDANFLLLDWKQGNQSGARRGIAVSRITGTTPDLWSHNTSDSLQELARGIRLGDVGWRDHVEYEFTFEFNAERLRVFVDGELEIDLEGEFQDGRLAFYNASQSHVRYSAFTIEALVLSEGETIDLSAPFVDPGIDDTHQATIDWADGTIEPAPVTVGEITQFVHHSHTYLDNGLYDSEVCVTDDDGGTGCGVFPILVANVAPTVEAGPDATGVVGLPFQLTSATFSDPGLLDTHDAVINWGDGATSLASVTGTADLGEVSANHVYAVEGDFTVEVCVTDDDGGVGCDTIQMLIEPAPAGEPELLATKVDLLQQDTDGNGATSPGDVVRYVITISNVGGAQATGVSLTDLIPVHTRVVAGSVTAVAGTVLSEEPVEVSFGVLPADQSVVVTFDVTVDNPLPVGVEVLNNQAAVISDQLPTVLSDDPDVGGHADPTLTMVMAMPRLVVEKTDTLALDADGNGTPSPGDEIVYTLTLRNLGTVAATGVELVDPVPVHAALVPGSVSTSDGTLVGEDPVEVHLDQLPVGDVLTLTFQVRVDNPIAVGVDQVVNQAVVTADGVDQVPSDDPDASGVADPTVTEIEAAPVLAVDKTVNLFADADANSLASPGDQLLYRLEVSNSGNTAASQVVLSDPLPAHTTLVPASVQTSSGAIVSDNPIEVALGQIEADTVATVTFRVTVDDPFPLTTNEVSNQALVTSAELEAVASDDPATTVENDPTVLPIFVTPEVEIDDVTVVEGPEAAASFTVTLSRPTPRPVVVTFQTSSGSALSEIDFISISSSVTIEAGQLSSALAIPMIDDAIDELDEFFLLTLTAADGGLITDGEGLATIVDNDEALISIDNVTVQEGDSGTTDAVFNISLATLADREIRVDYGTSADTATADVDYLTAAGTAVFPPGSTMQTLSVSVVGDVNLEELEETFLVELSGAIEVAIADPLGVGTIVDDEVCLGPNLLLNPDAELRGDNRWATPGWTLEAGDWHRNLELAEPISGRATFAAGEADFSELFQDIDITALASRVDGGDQRFELAAFVQTSEETPPDVVRLVVEYRDAGNALVLAAVDLGEITSPSEWQRISDVSQAPIGTRFIRLRLLGTRFAGPSIDAFVDALSLRPLRLQTLTIDDATAYEQAGPAVFTVRLACAWEHEVTIQYATFDNTALASEDYTPVDGTLLFPAGTTSWTVTVPLVDDSLDEPGESFFVELSAVTSTGGEPVVLDPRGVGTILDGDFCPRSHGYWKTHLDLWPVNHLVIGALEYEMPQLEAFLNARGGDQTEHLALQLVAAKLNLARGSDPSILPVVEAADAFLELHPPGSNPRGEPRREAEVLKDQLDAYVNRPCSE